LKKSKGEGVALIVPHAAALLCVTDRTHRSAYATAQACTLGLWPAAIQVHIILVCCFMVSTPIIHVITQITTHLPTRGDGRLSQTSWLTQIGRFTHEVVTCRAWIGHRSGRMRTSWPL